MRRGSNVDAAARLDNVLSIGVDRLVRSGARPPRAIRFPLRNSPTQGCVGMRSLMMGAVSSNRSSHVRL